MSPVVDNVGWEEHMEGCVQLTYNVLFHLIKWKPEVFPTGCSQYRPS